MLVLYALARQAFDEVVGRPEAELPFLLAVVVLTGVLALGVVHRWRWLFWLLMLAFLASAIAIPVDALQLAGLLPGARGPAWYQLARMGVSVAELGLGIAMVVAYRRTRRTWG